MKHLARFAVPAIAAAALLAPACTATAATGGIDELVQGYEASIQKQFAFIAPHLVYNNVVGATAEDASPTATITINLNQMEGLRNEQSVLAPLVSVASATVKFIGSPGYDDEPIGLYGENAVCIVGATAQGYLDENHIVSTPDDDKAMQNVAIAEFSASPKTNQMVLDALKLGRDRGHDACGVDVSHI